MKEPRWLSIDAVLAIHERMVMVFGGDDGVRDVGLLDSALNRPINAFHYEEGASLERLAALYIHGICMNHPFIDGNKRAGFSVGCVFLALNGRWLTAPEAEAAAAILSLASGEMDEQGIEAWIKDRCVAL